MKNWTNKVDSLLILLLLLISVTKSIGQNTELKKFSFLVGDFAFKGKTLNSSGAYSEYEGTWSGKFVLDGGAIVEEFKIIGPQGTPVFFGMTTRAYNSKEKKWVMGFFDALNPAWYPLGNPSFGKDGAITFYGRFPGMVESQKLRIKFYDISKESFKWKSDLSVDGGKTWQENYTIIDAKRR